MNAYRVRDLEATKLAYHFEKTLKDAQDTARAKFPKDTWHDIRIELVEVKTDATSVISYLNWAIPTDTPVLRTWRLSPRGGLVELDSNGKPAKDSQKESA